MIQQLRATKNAVTITMDGSRDYDQKYVWHLRSIMRCVKFINCVETYATGPKHSYSFLL